jgi:hypothetical protein
MVDEQVAGLVAQARRKVVKAEHEYQRSGVVTPARCPPSTGAPARCPPPLAQRFRQHGPARRYPAGLHRPVQPDRAFNWKFTAADLTGLLHRIGARQEPANQIASLPKAA